MRTTLTLDEDIFQATRDLARQRRTTMGDVVSDLLRQALTKPEHQPTQPTESFYGFSPLPRRGVIVTSQTVSSIREEEGI